MDSATKSPLLPRSSIDSEDSSRLLSAKEAQIHSFSNARARRRNIIAACLFLLALSLAGMAAFVLWAPYSSRLATPPAESVSHENSTEPLQLIDNSTQPQQLDPWDPRLSLNGAPTAQFRENLKPGVKYITSWPAAGWTNDVMTYANLIYLGFITDRVPVIPMFTPSHINMGATSPVPSIAFGDVFDVPRMRNLTGKSILEWRDLKDIHSQSVDEIGCWNVWESVQYHEHHPRGSSVPDHLKLDISYTKSPHWVKLYPDFEHDAHATFWSLARLAFPETLRDQNLLVTPLPSPLNGVSLPPDEDMVCFDYLYYVCAQQPYEYDKDYSPAWRYVAQYMHWTPWIEKLAQSYVNLALGLPKDEPTPPVSITADILKGLIPNSVLAQYIAIHVRHYDFAGWCGDVPLNECFASIPVIARRVKEVQDQIQEQMGVTVNHIVMTSDERDEAWWKEVEEQGWKFPDHSRTKEIFGDWYPVLIDAAIQSGGVGFVGTDRSTMSIMAMRRVQSWQGGVARLVKWGHAGADDH
ncbi:hypothetical protein D9757_004678 [Collybiopsis confluens]|uniref:Uncharacterized protein n=1 Tax=Collybiopsis confluens TaxID=2823264 RepID=A0A8H5HS51_9AGAR|nr:hypothetical protein D9757_004678 [Collybiopsis confluens]